MSDQAPLTEEQRLEALWRLYDALLIHLLEAFQAEKPPAANLVNVARQFLGDNHINLASRPDLRRGLAAMAGIRNLPFKV